MNVNEDASRGILFGNTNRDDIGAVDTSFIHGTEFHPGHYCHPTVLLTKESRGEYRTTAPNALDSHMPQRGSAFLPIQYL